MDSLKDILRNLKTYTQHMPLILVLLVSTLLRFYNLGYSDYIGDEHKAFYTPNPDQSMRDFFLSRRKGPVQFIVSHIPYSITGDFRNELAQRIPFSVISVLSVLVFYLLVERISKRKSISLVSALLYSVNGFILGFGRIAQYQNFNLLFSFLALYFYSFLLEGTKDVSTKRHSLYGTFFWCLSILTHWDAIFIIPVVVYFWLVYLRKREIENKTKVKHILHNFILGCVLLLPFLIPYLLYQLNNAENMQYFSRRVEVGHINYERYGDLFILYNPFVTLWVLAGFSLVGLLKIKKNYYVVIWFVVNYLAFELFVRKPGTHIYNFLIPVFILTSYGVVFILDKLKKAGKLAYLAVIVVIFTFLVYQAFVLFIDHTREYPWERKVLLSINHPTKKVKEGRKKVPVKVVFWETQEYTVDDKLPLFGFPHRRYWNEINAFVNEQNIANDEELSYLSNEVRTISEWYMDADCDPGENSTFYFIGVKKPLSFVNDWKYSHLGKKETVHEIQNEYGTTVVRIYRANK